MRLFHSGKRQMFAFFVPGFLLGIIYVNVVAKEYMADIEIFSEYYLTHFSPGGIVVREYLPYLLRVRLIPLLFLAALAFTKLRKAAARIFSGMVRFYRRDHSFVGCGRAWDHGQLPVCGLCVSAFFLLCTGVSDPFVVLLQCSKDSVESPEDGFPHFCDGGRDHT